MHRANCSPRRTDRRPAAAESGQTLVLCALMLTVMLGFAALVVNAGTFLVQRRDMQGDADAAALAAVTELPASQSTASSVARDYVETRNSDHGLLQSATFGDGGSSVTVTVATKGTRSFGSLLGSSQVNIRAHATARVQMMGPRPGMLPLAFMRDSFTVGQNYDVKFQNSATGNRGAIAPAMAPTCGAAHGASDFGKLIRGAAYGGVDACAAAIATTVDTEPGNMSGQTKAAFSDRLGTNHDTFEQTFELDATTGTYRVLKPTSPRIGIVPVVEHSNGTNVWPNGRSTPVRILAYMLVYIGDRSDPPNYPATTDGKAVWVTPVRALMPEEYGEGSFVSYDSRYPAPIAFRLVD